MHHVDGLPLTLIMALVSSRSHGLPDDLAALALTLLLYDTASGKGLLAHSDPERSVPRAYALARQIEWHIQRPCLDKGHRQGERYAFYCRVRSDRPEPGNRRRWIARPLGEAWDGFEWVGGQTAVTWDKPLVVPEEVTLRNVFDFRALLLRVLFDVHATPDKGIGERAWHISTAALGAMFGASYYAMQTALNRAGLRKVARFDARGVEAGTFYVMK